MPYEVVGGIECVHLCLKHCLAHNKGLVNGSHNHWWTDVLFCLNWIISPVLSSLLFFNVHLFIVFYHYLTCLIFIHLPNSVDGSLKTDLIFLEFPNVVQSSYPIYIYWLIFYLFGNRIKQLHMLSEECLQKWLVSCNLSIPRSYNSVLGNLIDV